MVRANMNSIFDNVDLDDASSIRRVMTALNYYLTNQVLSQAAPELRAMQSSERKVTGLILSTVRTQHNYPLLLEATLRFIEERNGDDQQVRAAARALEILAPGIVLTAPEAFPVQYAAAEEKFNRTRDGGNFVAKQQDLQQRAPGAFGPQVFSSKTGAKLDELKKSMELKTPKASDVYEREEDFPHYNKRGHKSDEEDFEPSEGSGRPKKNKSPMKKTRVGGPSNKIPGPKISSKTKKKPGKKLERRPSSASDLSSTLASEEMFNPFPDKEEDRGAAKHHKNKPLRKPGDRVVDDGTHDRTPCTVGKPHPKKLIIEFPVECDDPNNPGRTISKPPIKFNYSDPVDWTNKESVQALTKWRGQIFFRVLGAKRESRLVWLESERDALFDILQEHLAKVGDRCSQVRWDQVAAIFNQRFKGQIQKAGEVTAERQYDLTEKTESKIKTGSKKKTSSKYKKNSDGQATSTSQPLKKDRKAPERSAGSLRSQIFHFTHPLAQKIVVQAKAEDRKANAGEANMEDEEITETDEDEESDDEELESEGYMEEYEKSEAKAAKAEETVNRIIELDPLS